jgi:hypothetical protein
LKGHPVQPDEAAKRGGLTFFLTGDIPTTDRHAPIFEAEANVSPENGQSAIA